MTPLQPVRGTKDLLPEECLFHNRMTHRVRQICETYGFFQMATPIFEFSQVFKPVGESSDILTKETYTFQDRNGETLTLRPEGTAAVVRAVISNGLTQQTPLKYFYAGPMFRYDRPQKGRQRQFTQLGCELIGISSPQGDIEVLSLAHRVLEALHLKDPVTLEINSLGDAQSRATYGKGLVEYLQDYKTHLSEESQKRLKENPLRILDSKDPGDAEIILKAPSYADALTPEAQDFFAQVREGLDMLGIPYTLNPRLVRGLDYYTHTAFEFVSKSLGAQSTVLAGGRYNGLMKALGGPDLPGIGWAAGLERLALLSTYQDPMPRPLVVIPVGDESMEKLALQVSDTLRRAGHYVEQGYGGNLTKRLKKAHKLKASYVIILGEEEKKSHEALIRDLDRGTQDRVNLKTLSDYFLNHTSKDS